MEGFNFNSLFSYLALKSGNFPLQIVEGGEHNSRELHAKEGKARVHTQLFHLISSEMPKNKKYTFFLKISIRIRIQWILIRNIGFHLPQTLCLFVDLHEVLSHPEKNFISSNSKFSSFSWIRIQQSKWMRGATPDCRIPAREAKDMTCGTLARNVKTSHQGVFSY